MRGELPAVPSSSQLREIFIDIIEGKVVKRAQHTLIWGKKDCTMEFLETLKERGYVSTLVRDVLVEPGERVPGFVIEGTTAYFGWVFWEKFSQLRMRKLFGSIVRKGNGDWAIQIPEKRLTTIYAKASLRSEMDIENPSCF